MMYLVPVSGTLYHELFHLTDDQHTTGDPWRMLPPRLKYNPNALKCRD